MQDTTDEKASSCLAGELLDTMTLIGNEVYGYKVVDPYEPCPIIGRTAGEGFDCPRCGGCDTIYLMFTGSWCRDCYLIWETVKIGEYKMEEGDDK